MAAFGPGNPGWKGLAIGPNRAILKMFLFPDGYGALERVDQPTAGIESGRPVGGSDHDQHASFANFQTA
jgi:hypothetical protein